MTGLLSDLHRVGFADLGAIDPALTSTEVAAAVAKSIDAVNATSPDVLRVSTTGSKPPNTYGGNYGLGELPLHTDLAHWHLPPRYVMLRCIVDSSSVATRVLDSKQLVQYIPSSLMRRAMFTPRRRLDGKMFFLRMLTDDLFRWDPLFLQPQNSSANSALRLMLDIAPDLPVTNILLSAPGHTILMDNWRVLHGRSAVPTADINRQVERVYMEVSANGNQSPT